MATERRNSAARHEAPRTPRDPVALPAVAATGRRRAFASSVAKAATQPEVLIREHDVFSPGQVIADTYVIRELIGEGGMGQVFEAYDRNVARNVAIKASWPHVDPSFLKREAQALAAIRHPAAVTVYASGCHQGTWFVAMERLRGEPLDVHLARRGRLAVTEVTEILIALADALVAVHDTGIVHRDVKPSNIMLLPNRRLVLMDFGLFGTDGTGATLEVSGTPDYMAPETATGLVQPRDEYLVDIYAIGVVAFELLTGELPFGRGSAYATMRKQVQSTVPSLLKLRPDVPAALEALVNELLEKNPDARPRSAAVVVERLRSIRSAMLAAPFRVLVVDDDPNVARVIQHYVKSTAPDAEVATAPDARTALRLMAETPPDLALVDLQMPQMSGLELVMYLGGAHRAHIAIVSAGAMPGDVELLRSLGITSVIRKDERLRGEVAACVRSARQRWRDGAAR
ncbi:MAG: protein kinase [Deltaproteobacteria bacterium]|nr:protein kinase [Deltaproteobacteria bacterium]